MVDDFIKIINLGDFTKEEKDFINSDLTLKKQMSKIWKQARQNAKRDTCYVCGKKVESFCNSHSVPRFCLKNIASDGEVLTLNAIIDNPFIKSEEGVGKAGTFHLICNECDSLMFSNYENPENYKNKITQKMVAQMALKNSLKSISKRLNEIELYNIGANLSKSGRSLREVKNYINELDLKEYENSYKKAKKALERNGTSDYYVCYEEKLGYVVPIAFQCSIALIVDFEGNIINDIYNTSTKYEMRNINICILPLKSETFISMFIEDGDKRYRQFYRQFNKLTLDDKLAALTFIIFAYSEDVFFSKSIQQEILNSQNLCSIGKGGTDVISEIPIIDSLNVIKKAYDLSKRNSIPNLLSEKYKIR